MNWFEKLFVALEVLAIIGMIVYSVLQFFGIV